MNAREVAEWIARDASCAQGEFHARVNSMLPYLTDFADELDRMRALIVLGDFTNLRPNSDSFKLVQQIRREQSTGEQTAPEQEKRVTRTHFDTDGCDPPKWYGPTGE